MHFGLSGQVGRYERTHAQRYAGPIFAARGKNRAFGSFHEFNSAGNGRSTGGKRY